MLPSLSQIQAQLKGSTAAPTPSTPSKVVNFKFGGSYNLGTDPNQLIQSPRGYGGVSTVSGSQRDHIFPVSLGGTSDANNIQIRNNVQAEYRDNVEKYVASQVKAGKLKLNAARVMVLNWENTDIPGQKAYAKTFGQPQSVLSNFFKSIPEGVRQTVAVAFDTVKAGAENLAPVLPALKQAIKEKNIAPLKKFYNEDSVNLYDAFKTEQRNGKLVFTDSQKARQAIEKLSVTAMGFVNPAGGAERKISQEASLLTEARKYKSAEEFVKAQGTPVYHGSPYASKIEGEGFKLGKNENLVNAFGRGTYLSTSKRSAGAYAGLPEKGGGVVNAYLPKDIKLKTVSDSQAYTIDAQKLIQQGYGGVILDTGSSKHITVFDPSVIKTKSQLIDIWKKAHAGAETTQRGFVSSVKKKFPDIPAEGQYIPRPTDKLSIKARNLVIDDIRTAEKLALTGTNDSAVATANELVKYYGEQATKATSVAVRDAFNQKAAEIANSIAVKLTEQGRAVQAASILGKLTPEGQVRFAAREIQRYNEGVALSKQIPELTGEQTGYILDEMKAINALPDGEAKALKFHDLQEYISKLVPTPLMQKIITVWKAGLLTGIKTTGLNIFANVSHFGSEIVKDIPAKAVDSVASLFTGKKTVGGVTFKGIGAGGKEGFYKGVRYLKTGFDERNIATKLDYTKVNFGKGTTAKVFQTYTDSVFKLLGAEDQVFYYGAFSRSIADQARAQALTQGLKGTERAALIDKLMQNPTDEMMKYAITDAETAVFQNKTVLGNVARGVQNIAGGAGEFVVPFGRTPSAVAMQIINYSPIGITKTIIENIGKGRFDQRLFSQGMGRAITGTGVLAIGVALFKAGLMTLDRPTTEKEQKLWELEGKKPNAILIGGKWRTIQVFGPVGNVLLVGGQFSRAFDESGSPSEAIASALAGSAKSFTEQTFLTGINQVVSAINDPQRSAANFAGSTLSSTIPTLVGDIARATDAKERRTQTILDRFTAKIPGLRYLLQPKIDVLGNEIDRIGNPLEVLADPTRPQSAIETPVVRELRRLFDAGYDVTPSQLGDKNGYAVLSPEQNTALWKKAGEITNQKLGRLFLTPQYALMSEDQKAKTVGSFVEQAQNNARAEMVLNVTANLYGEDLKKKLSELKAAKLLTKPVFDIYQTLR